MNSILLFFEHSELKTSEYDHSLHELFIGVYVVPRKVFVRSVFVNLMRKIDTTRQNGLLYPGTDKACSFAYEKRKVLIGICEDLEE